MQIVIDISEEEYNLIKMKSYIKIGGVLSQAEWLIIKGTPLPKGHGRLIDADAATKDINAFQAAFAMYTDNMGKYNIVCAAPTVIEADKDGE